MDDTISRLTSMLKERDILILQLAERVYICSRLLTCAAERLGWDSEAVQGLVKQIEEATRRDEHAGIHAE